ncbi:TonB-dependent receptor [Granulicella arctica]|uniref:TonB-dependent receptor n=1 Tax=Granulicella arctica TaxID=940613 RepID=UPI0021E082A1|nr:TonB-dependent receptor [Granulicella arctica]
MCFRNLAAFLLFVAISPLVAQVQPIGEIKLHITDPSGASLQVAGRINGPGGMSRTLQTDEQGKLDLTGLAPGHYRLQIARSGFVPQSLSIDLTSTMLVSREIKLGVQGTSTSVNVFSLTPIGQADQSFDQIPVSLQGITAKNLEDSNALDLADLMNKHLTSVFVNENVGNPYQPDINYRGYTASPLLGTPEGLSVYLDGVRQNQPFGDVVAWDLIPKIAIRDMALIPGSDPVYGLNTLGGAISVHTKDGLTTPGASLQITGGKFGRRSGEGEIGGLLPHGYNYYVAGNLYREDGWRQYSSTEVRQSFAKLGWSDAKTTFSLAGAYADNWLTGNGTSDFRFLKTDYSSVNTIPDVTWDRSPSLTLNATHALSDKLILSSNAYYRYVRTDSSNGDLNDDSFDQSLYNLSAADIAALKAAGYTGFPITGNVTSEPTPFWRCLAQVLEDQGNGEPSEKCDGIVTRTTDKQNSYGLSGLMTWRRKHNRLIIGAGWDRGTSTYKQLSQLAYLNPDNVSFTLVDAFIDGSIMSGGNPVDTRVQLHGIVNTPSIYATDTLTYGSVSLTLSGRYNHTALDNLDYLPVSAARGNLTSTNTFQRFNPAVGLTYKLSRFFNTYFNYSEASRSPTSIELGCSDPNEPCNLPNALVSDPPLKQVVSRTFEAGIRSNGESTFHWSADYFFGQNSSDLLFVASEQTGFGYFLNFGKTRRDGIELELGEDWSHWSLGGNYTFLNATYQSPQTIDGGSNSTNDSALAGLKGIDDDIHIVPGDYIPQVPRNLLKLYGQYKPSSKLTAELDILAAGSSFARGNENNLDQPDGVYYLGSGKSAGYGVASIGAHYQIRPRIQLFVQANNLLDKHYSTGAQLGTTPFDNNDHLVARPFGIPNGSGAGTIPIRTSTFLAPGTPFNIYGGFKITLWNKH